MEGQRHIIHIELNNGSYGVYLLSPFEDHLTRDEHERTIFIKGLINRHLGMAAFFDLLKKTKQHSLLSINHDGHRYIYEHIDVHLHLNVGNPNSIRDKNIFLIEWVILNVGVKNK